MKISIVECDHVFAIDIQPESMSEAALLVRMGVNANKAIHYLGTNAYRDGTFNTSLSLKKAKRSTSTVGRERS